jgi:hypothetical protein
MYNDIYRLVGERIEDPETFNTMLYLKNKALDPIVAQKADEFQRMKIVGMREEHYPDQHCRQYPGGDIYYVDDIFTRHIICGRYHGDNYELSLSLQEGECPSGYIPRVTAELNTKKVDRFKNITFTPIHPIAIEYPFTMKNVSSYDTILQEKNEVFCIDSYGGDEYYPAGFYNVNMDLFRKNIRAKEKRPVWLFRGDSGAGKSFIGNALTFTNKIFSFVSVPFVTFETDMYKELPDKFPLSVNVIVMGNKYKHSIDDVKDRIEGDHELIMVNFSNEENSSLKII